MPILFFFFFEESRIRMFQCIDNILDMKLGPKIRRDLSFFLINNFIFQKLLV